MLDFILMFYITVYLSFCLYPPPLISSPLFSWFALLHPVTESSYIYNIVEERRKEKGSPHMKAAPSSGPHYWRTDIWDIFFRFSDNRPFDLWTGIRISLQKSYRWKDNRAQEICLWREKMNWSSRTAQDSFPSRPSGICFGSDLARTHWDFRLLLLP